MSPSTGDVPTSPRQHPRGADLDALATWLGTVRPDLATAPLSGSLIEGGRSNLTYLLTDAVGAQFVLRRPPLGHVLATAHDMGREARVLSALAGTDVPVPEVLAEHGEADVLGAPFYLMSRAAGTAYRTAEQLAALGPQRTAAIVEQMMDVLARLHAIDPEHIGLRDFGRPQGFLARQVTRWRAQLDASHSRDLPGLDELSRSLAETVPAQAAPGIVHGDYRLDNLLVHVGPGHETGRDTITAVLDWEMSTIGDPLSDLALLLVYSAMGRNPAFGDAVTTAPQAQGYPDDRALVERYAAGSGRDLTHLSWYVAMANFKLAGVTEGIYYRYRQGQTVGDGFERFGQATTLLLDAGLEALSDPAS